jgi:hypothetical protein
MLYAPKRIEYIYDTKVYVPASQSARFISNTTWSIQMKFDTGTLSIISILGNRLVIIKLF